MINKTNLEQILNEYEKKRLSKERYARSRKSLIEEKIPKLKTIDNAIASLSVSQAVSKIRGGSGDPEYNKKLDLLTAEKDRLLKENGFSKEDLLPVYDCSLCNDTGYVDGNLCSCVKAKLNDSFFENTGLRETLKKENFRTFNTVYYSNEIQKGAGESPLQRATASLKKAIDFVNDFNTSAENLLITGSCGVGKTFLINCIVAELIDKDISIIYLSSSRFFKLLADSTFRRQDADLYLGENMPEQAYNCDLLVIDDLGTEIPNSFIINSLFECINERLLRRKHTIISTNLSLNQLRDTYGERIASRLTSSYRYIELLGDDIRIMKMTTSAGNGD